MVLGVEYVKTLVTLACVVGWCLCVELSSVGIGEKWGELWVLFGDFCGVERVPFSTLELGCVGLSVFVDLFSMCISGGFGTLWVLTGHVGVLMDVGPQVIFWGIGETLGFLWVQLGCVGVLEIVDPFGIFLVDNIGREWDIFLGIGET